MAFLHSDRPFSWQWFLSYCLLILGAAIVAAGFVLFFIPFNIIPGGVYGLAIIADKLLQTNLLFSVGYNLTGLMGFVIVLPLIIVSRFFVGRRYGIKTIIAFLFTSVFIDFFIHVFGTNDPLKLSDDVLLSCIFGSVLLGIGYGLIYKSKTTICASDIMAIIINRKTQWSVSQLLVYIDSVIIIFGLLVFDNWKLPLYSWLAIYIAGKVSDLLIAGFNYEKMLTIISVQADVIALKIKTDFNRDGIVYDAKSILKDDNRKVINIIVNKRELAMIEEIVQEIDSFATIAVSDTTAILGDKFDIVN